MTALAAALTTLAIWQSTIAQPEPPLEARQKPEEKTLVLLVRTDPDVTKQKVEVRLKLGLDMTNCKYAGVPIVTERSSAFFEEMEDLFGRGGAAPAAASPGSIVSFRELPSRTRLWECKLPKTGQRAKTITVTYQDAKDKVYRTETTVPAEQLTTIVPGTYALQLLPGDQPLKWKAEIEELDPKTGDVKTLPVVEGEWPKSDNYYAVTINKFVGEEKELFDALENKIANKLKNIQPVRNYTFVFASWSAKRRTPPPPLQQNTYNPMVNPIDGPTPQTRVWMLFPLTKAQMLAKLDEFRKHSEVDLPKEIRKSNPVLATENVGVVDKDSPAKWYELPLVEEGDSKGFFNRPILLKDFKELDGKFNKKDEKGNEGLYRLLVWESGTPPQAIEFLHPVENRNLFVLNEEQKQLATMLTLRAAEQTPPTPAPKK